MLSASPIALAKAAKTAIELDGMRQAHVRDGAALTAWLAWLEHTLAAGTHFVDTHTHTHTHTHILCHSFSHVHSYTQS